MEKLEKLGLVEDSEGARVIFIEGVDIPIIAVKRDGGYNYSSTDLASIWLVFTLSLRTDSQNLCYDSHEYSNFVINQSN